MKPNFTPLLIHRFWIHQCKVPLSFRVVYAFLLSAIIWLRSTSDTLNCIWRYKMTSLGYGGQGRTLDSIGRYQMDGKWKINRIRIGGISRYGYHQIYIDRSGCQRVWWMDRYQSASVGMDNTRWYQSASVGMENTRWYQSVSVGMDNTRWYQSASVGMVKCKLALFHQGALRLDTIYIFSWSWWVL